MRARMALSLSGAPVKIREVVLRDKPAEMLEASPKGTVPVLVLNNGEIIDESAAIMQWALHQNPDNDLGIRIKSRVRDRLLEISDGSFKAALDRYKYANRYTDENIDPVEQREICAKFLRELNSLIFDNGGQIMGPTASFADIAIFPFVRQFANTDREWFDAQDWSGLHEWLAGHLSSTLFQSIMKKYSQWQPGGLEPALPLVTA